MGFKGILRRITCGIWVPQSDFLLQFICNLFTFLLLSPIFSFISCLNLNGSRCVHRILEQMNKLCYSTIIVRDFLLEWEFVHGWEVGDWVSWRKQRQQVWR